MAAHVADDVCVEAVSRPSRRTASLSPADVSRFVRDPHAFASSVGAASSSAFVSAYLNGLEKRLDEATRASGTGHRLATLGASDLPSTGCLGDAGDDAPGRAPHMGALVIALAIVAAIPWISIGFL